MRSRAAAAGILIVTLAAQACSPPAEAPRAVRTAILETGPLLIDRLYHSMDGPHERIPLDVPGMDWIIAYRTEVLDAESGARMGDEFFCHSQLQLGNLTRLLVTATGSAEIVFPPGFGMPLRRILGGIPTPEWRSTTVLGMVLNNFDVTMNRNTRVRATIEYLPEPEAEARGLKKLYKVELPMTVQPGPGEAPDAVSGGESCVIVEGLKSHWMVPPGRQVTRKRYAGIVPVEATVHFVNAHLHNHGVQMTLRDLTTGAQLWQTDVRYEPARRQILRIPDYSSVEGFRIFPDHEYEIESVYENVSDAPIDAMAAFYLYYHPVRNEDITYPDPPPGVTLDAPGEGGEGSHSHH